MVLRKLLFIPWFLTSTLLKKNKKTKKQTINETTKQENISP